jgi:hypothetical protein
VSNYEEWSVSDFVWLIHLILESRRIRDFHSRKYSCLIFWITEVREENPASTFIVESLFTDVFI